MNLGVGWRLEVDLSGSVTNNVLTITAITEVAGLTKLQTIYALPYYTPLSLTPILAPLGPCKLLGLIVSSGDSFVLGDYILMKIWLSQSDTPTAMRQIQLFNGSIRNGVPIIVSGEQQSFDSVLFTLPFVDRPTFAAGVNFSWWSTVHYPVLVDTISFDLVTDATVVNRYMCLTCIEQGLNVVWRVGTVTNLSASHTYHITFCRAPGLVFEALQGSLYPLPDIILPNGWGFVSAIQGLTATDAITNACVTFRTR
jgi:hypothetical protein